MTLIDNVTHEDITSKASFYAGEQLLNGTSFTTEVPGTYTLKAVFGDITSNTVEIKAVSGDIDAEGITLSVSKEMVFPDGGDFAVLTLTDADGADVSDLGEFYADGKALEGRRFRLRAVRRHRLRSRPRSVVTTWKIRRKSSLRAISISPAGCCSKTLP